MELYLKVRLACRDGMSAREAARQFGISRESVKKMLSFSVPPGYRRMAPIKRPKLGGFTEIIDQWLGDDVGRPRKQRHTAKRVFDRLRDEHGFTGGYTIVKDYVRDQQRRRREMFVPLHHAPGHAQAAEGSFVRHRLSALLANNGDSALPKTELGRVGNRGQAKQTGRIVARGVAKRRTRE